MKQIQKNCIEFIRLCSNIVGNFNGDVFECNTHTEFEDNPIDSPIEQIFYTAFNVLRICNHLDQSDPVEFNKKMYIVGLGINAQEKVGKYRCDFQTYYATPVLTNGTQEINKCVYVECDSQAFHERTEAERRYEKARDRYIQSKGDKIFHFTGKEIIDHPFLCAAEVIAYLTEQPVEDISGSIVNYT